MDNVNKEFLALTQMALELNRRDVFEIDLEFNGFVASEDNRADFSLSVSQHCNFKNRRVFIINDLGFDMSSHKIEVDNLKAAQKWLKDLHEQIMGEVAAC